MLETYQVLNFCLHGPLSGNLVSSVVEAYVNLTRKYRWLNQKCIRIPRLPLGRLSLGDNSNQASLPLLLEKEKKAPECLKRVTYNLVSSYHLPRCQLRGYVFFLEKEKFNDQTALLRRRR